MAVHSHDRTMDVKIDGKVVRRPIDYIDVTARRPEHRNIPVVNDDEEIFWSVGDDVPMIMKVR